MYYLKIKFSKIKLNAVDKKEHFSFHNHPENTKGNVQIQTNIITLPHYTVSYVVSLLS